MRTSKERASAMSAGGYGYCVPMFRVGRTTSSQARAAAGAVRMSR
ncbi:hypothetical protein ACQP25_18495 [Microtetraspora malaysiensis]